MPRNKYPERTIKKIVDVATRLFMKKGYDNTSIQDIVNEIKMSKGAIYHHFKDKEEIWEAVCKQIVENESTELAKIKDNCLLNGQEKLISILNSAIFSKTIMPDTSSNYRFYKLYHFQIQYINTNIIPKFIYPVVNEGISDGSIEIAFPKEIAEAFVILNFSWLNFPLDSSELSHFKNRNLAYHFMLQQMGITDFDNN